MYKQNTFNGMKIIIRHCNIFTNKNIVKFDTSVIFSYFMSSYIIMVINTILLKFCYLEIIQ